MSGLKNFLEYLRSNPILPYSRFTKNKIEDIERKLIEITDIYNDFQKTHEENIENIKNHSDKLEQHYKNIHAISKELMKVKWKQIDNMASQTEMLNDLVKCGICEYEAERKSFEIKEAVCDFNGGKLTRYICPSCGVIFGPTKFLNLTQREKDEDYYIHYLGFEEGDSTDKEIKAFHMLEPHKGGIYLNYGCGSWSNSLKQLEKEGYTVYGYEPYAELELHNPMLISNTDELKKFRFDGIFSNNLLEHLTDPITDLKFMKSLLRDGNSKMAHSTPCYIYKYEITRFHTYFYTGNSVKVLCEKVGLDVCGYENDIEENDFICYVFKNSDSESDYMSAMCINENGVRQDDGRIILNENGILYGPYFTYSKGLIRFQIDLTIKISKRGGYFYS